MSSSKSDQLRTDVQRYLEEQLSNHLAQRSSYVENHDLKVEINRLNFGSQGANLTVTVHGTLNNAPFHWRKWTNRKQGMSGAIGGAAGGAVGGLIVGLASSALNTALEAANRNPIGESVAGCAEDLCSKLLIKIDRLLKVPLEPLELQWRSRRKYQWSAALACFVLLFMLIMIFPDPTRFAGLSDDIAWRQRLILAAFNGSFSAVGGFIIAYALSLLTMPDKFFDTMTGRSVMSFSGVKTVGGVRAVCMTLILVLAAGILGLAYTFLPKVVDR